MARLRDDRYVETAREYLEQDPDYGRTLEEILAPDVLDEVKQGKTGLPKQIVKRSRVERAAHDALLLLLDRVAEESGNPGRFGACC